MNISVYYMKNKIYFFKLIYVKYYFIFTNYFYIWMPLVLKIDEKFFKIQINYILLNRHDR